MQQRPSLTDEQLVLKALEYLNCHDGPSGTYQMIVQTEKEKSAIWLGPILGRYWYLPLETEPRTARSILNRLINQGPPDQRVEGALSDLWNMTKKSNQTAATKTEVFQSYLNKLARYEAERVIQVLRNLSETEEFFPSWAKVRSSLTNAGNARTGLILFLEKSIPKLKGTQNEQSAA